MSQHHYPSTPWTRERLQWVRECTDDQLQAVIADVARNSDLDENEGDRRERADALRWLATRGLEGEDWGHAADSARKHGWTP